MSVTESRVFDDSPSVGSALPEAEPARTGGDLASQGTSAVPGPLGRALLWAGRFLGAVVIGLALASVAVVAILRWVDPPASAFMLRHALVTAGLGRPPPHYHYQWVPLEEIPASVRIAAIAAEDQRFPVHHGFDPVEIRKAWAHYRRGGGLRGASTITQQTAKNLFLWPERSWLRKGLEAWFTAWIEFLWPKERILEVYLNIVQLSPSTYGVGAASERYFHHRVSELTLEQASLLAGVLPAPGAYRLDKPSARLLRRAAWIADQSRRLGGARYLERL